MEVGSDIGMSYDKMQYKKEGDIYMNQHKKDVRKISVVSLVIILLLTMMPLNVSAASIASKVKNAQVAYGKYLSKHLQPARVQKHFYDAGYSEKDKSYVSSYELCDLDGDKVPELITITDVNFRWFIVRVYTYKNNKMLTYKFTNGKTVEFNNNASANGAYCFYICGKKHIHNGWSGYEEKNDTIYANSNGKLKTYISMKEQFIYDSTGGYNKFIAKKNGVSISKTTYKKFVDSCPNRKAAKRYKNNTTNRKLLAQGKCRIG